MTNRSGSTAPRRQLGRALREHRERAGISMKAAYEFMDCSYQRLWRLETGEPGVTIRATEVEALCTWYKVPGDTTKILVSLAKASKEQGWWQSYSNAIVKWSEHFFSLEAGASRLRQFESAIVPGLLQAQAYMELVIRADRPQVPEEMMADRVKLKQERQRLLQRAFPPAPRLEIIVAESLLHVELDIPGAMQQQLWHLLKASELPNVSVRVLPFAVGLHSASVSGGFTILEFPPLGGGRDAEPTTVYSEDLTGALYLDQADELAIYEQVWAELAEMALDVENSSKVITKILTSQGETSP